MFLVGEGSEGWSPFLEEMRRGKVLFGKLVDKT